MQLAGPNRSSKQRGYGVADLGICAGLPISESDLEVANFARLEAPCVLARIENGQVRLEAREECYKMRLSAAPEEPWLALIGTILISGRKSEKEENSDFQKARTPRGLARRAFGVWALKELA